MHNSQHLKSFQNKQKLVLHDRARHLQRIARLYSGALDFGRHTREHLAEDIHADIEEWCKLKARRRAE